MNRRRLAYATIAVLGVLCLAMIAGALYPVSMAEPTPADERFGVGDADSYRVSANITTDGDISLGVLGAVSDSGAQYARVTGEVTTESYRNASREGGGVVYERTVATGDHAEGLLAQAQDDPDVEVVSESWDDDRLTMLAIDRSDDATVEPTGAASVVANSMALARYEPVDGSSNQHAADGDGRTLEARGGWYEGQRPYRLTDVSGSVTVDPETNVLYHADVEWTLTEGTDTYLHYLLARESAVDQTYDYAYEPGDVAVERPEWVAQLQNGA